MTRAAAALLLTGSALLLAASSRTRASIEAGEGDDLLSTFTAPAPSLDVLSDRVETFVNTMTEQPANVPQEIADANASAFLQLLQQSEGTASQPDPYACCYGYSHTVQDMSDHPAVTGEWRGLQLSDSMCTAAGFGPGCVSSAAGAYQVVKGTWLRARNALGLLDFSAASQDRAALWLVQQRGALEDVKAGRIAQAIQKCRNEWASLPGNYAKQGQRQLSQLVAWYQTAGGTLA